MPGCLFGRQRWPATESCTAGSPRMQLSCLEPRIVTDRLMSFITKSMKFYSWCDGTRSRNQDFWLKVHKRATTRLREGVDNLNVK